MMTGLNNPFISNKEYKPSKSSTKLIPSYLNEIMFEAKIAISCTENMRQKVFREKRICSIMFSRRELSESATIGVCV